MTLVRGWCPGALRPMPSGDGLILRIRPPLGLIDRAQMEGIAAIALACGNGSVEFTRRANVQLRGLGEATLGQAQARLAALGLIDPDLSPQAEARLNILVTPFWPADGLPGIPGPGPVWAALRAGLVGWNAPPLPPKFGFAVDLSGGQRHLAGESADIRIEAAAEGGILVRADGVATGRRVGSADEAAELALALARWFAAQRPGADRPGRMRALIAQGIAPPAELGGEAEPAPQAALAEALRSCIGFDFGAAEPAQLFRIAAAMDGPLHVTPWRAVRLPRLADPAAALADCPDLLLAPDDPRWRRFACVGAPRCPQGLADPRRMAVRHDLLPGPGQVLHLSGCAKGCAHPEPADVTVTCTGGGRQRLARAARAGQGRRSTISEIRAALNTGHAP